MFGKSTSEAWTDKKSVKIIIQETQNTEKKKTEKQKGNVMNT